MNILKILGRLKLPELKEEADARGIEYVEDVTRKDLAEAIEAHDKANPQKENEPPAPPPAEIKASGGKGKSVYYWLKTTAYVDDTRRLPAGLYRFPRRIKRLDVADQLYVERFEGEIPNRALVVIAEARGIKYAASDDVDFGELLEKLVNEPAYF